MITSIAPGNCILASSCQKRTLTIHSNFMCAFSNKRALLAQIWVILVMTEIHERAVPFDRMLCKGNKVNFMTCSDLCIRPDSILDLPFNQEDKLKLIT